MSEAGDEAKVISILTRKPWIEEQAEKRRKRRSDGQKKRHDKNKAVQDHREAMLTLLDEVRELVEAGKFEGLIMFGRDPKTKTFFNDFVLDVSNVPLNDYFGFAGLLDVVSLELKQSATMAPAMMNDGSILDPYVEPPVEYEVYDPEDFE
jgi:hypothetical protein